MTNLTPSEARRIIENLRHNQTKEHGISILEEKYLAALEIALPVLEQQGVIGKPVAWLNDAYLARGVVDGEAGEDDAGPGYIPVYRHPQNATPQPQSDTYRQIENDGWVEWSGGECPVKDGAIVDVRLRSGQAKFFCASEALIWTNGNSVRDEMDCDIIAYRVIDNDGREG